MEKLISGIHRFESQVFRDNREFFARLSTGQSPQALFITCSDSRMVPDLITQADPGDLFVLRNAGNLVPSYGSNSGAEAAAIEYAIRGLKVKDIIICGHTNCGAMRALLNPEMLSEMPRVRDWLKHADSTKEIVESKYEHLTDEKRWKITVEENVLVQLENLRTHPSVAVALANGDIKLHGWCYRMDTGQVFGYNAESGQFESMIKPDGSHVVSPVAKRKATASTPNTNPEGAYSDAPPVA